MTQILMAVIQLAFAVGIPALIAYAAPRRWRIWAGLLWALAPVIIGLLIVAGAAMNGEGSPREVDNLIFGLMLIGSFVLIPWLLVCGAGYALGAVLRGRLRPPAAAAQPAPQAAAERVVPASARIAAPPVEADRPTLSPGGWRPAHVGFDGDDLRIDSLPVWSLPWRKTADAPVRLAHPAHPDQHHTFNVYGIEDGARATRFAAAELSNGVWGFYRWEVPADAPSGQSADASLRYDHDLGRFEAGRFDSALPSARLYDARSGTLLFDGAAWRTSRVVPQWDGSLLLSLEQAERQTLFRIDPAGASFRDLLAPDIDRPLAELAAAAETARAEADVPSNAVIGRRIAPDGALVVELEAVEWSNTHWARSPRVTEIATGRVLLDLWGTDWDAWPSFPRRQTVRLSLRRYHRGGVAEAEIEPERYLIFEGADVAAGALQDLPGALAAAADRSLADAPPRSEVPAPRATAAGLRAAAVILVAALTAIAALTWATLKLEGAAPPQKLDTIPPMPGSAKFETGNFDQRPVRRSAMPAGASGSPPRGTADR